MATTVAERIAALEEAMALGALEVEYEDRRVRYRSLAEMQEILAGLKGQLTPSSGVRTSRRRARYCSGL